jgi:hypothetical protein
MKPTWQGLAVVGVAGCFLVMAGCNGTASNAGPKPAAAKAVNPASLGDNEVVLKVEGMV